MGKFNQKSGFGKLTGIFLDSTDQQQLFDRRAIDPDKLWIESRFGSTGIKINYDEENEQINKDEYN